MTILAVGDSFTVPRYKGDKPWPTVLGELLNKEVFNNSREGSSNDCIFRRFVDSYFSVPNISLVVVGLSNWDRVPIGYRYYRGIGTADDYLKISRPGSWDGLAGKEHAHHYSPIWAIDKTLTYIYTIIELCDKKNIPVVFFQPIMPFHDISDPHIKKYEERNGISLTEYVNKHHLFKHIWTHHSDTILGLKWTGENITKEQLCPNNMWLWFCGKGYHESGRPDLHMGFHKNKLYDHEKPHDSSIYDAHPNLKGHREIAEFIYKGLNELDD